MYIPFDELAGQARLWVYQSDRKLAQKEIEFITQAGIDFTKSWTAHNKDLKASIKVFYDQFIVLSVDETMAAATGCSIDKSVNFIRAIEQELSINLLDRSKVAYVKNEEIALVSLPNIKEMVNSGEISQDSIIFNNTVSDMDSFQNTWRVEAQNSWMSRYF